MLIDQIANLGDDQMASQFEVVFPQGIPGGGDGTRLGLRMDQAFQVPEKTVGRYDVRYRGLQIPKTSNVDGTTKEFSLSFRVDQNWGVYDDLKRWRDLVYDDRNATSGSEAETRTTVIVNHYGTDNQIKKQWTFTGVKLFSMNTTESSHESEDPLRVECNFIFFKMND